MAISTSAAIFVLPLAAVAQDPAGAPATAAEGGPVSAERAAVRAQQIYTVRPQRFSPCPPERAGEIVVCRRLEDPETLRVPSPTDQAIADGKPVDDGVPRAPYVFGLPSCDVVKCHSIGSVPPPPLMIDLKALPEPPPGSDAASFGYQPPAGTAAAP
jgi:hypothetical protein